MHAPILGSRVAWYALGRFWPTGPGDAQVFDAGYFAHLDLEGAPISVPGQPLGPHSAYFTFSSEPLTTTPLQSGPLTVSVDTVGSFWIYYQPKPQGDFTKAESFAQGRRIARFRRPFLVVGAKLGERGELGVSTFTAELVESTPFEHAGRTYDLGELLPNGITQWSVATGSTAETDATFLGSAVAIGRA